MGHNSVFFLNCSYVIVSRMGKIRKEPDQTEPRKREPAGGAAGKAAAAPGRDGAAVRGRWVRRRAKGPWEKGK